MMAEGYSETTVFDCQVKACKTFFEDQLPTDEIRLLAEEDIPENMDRFKKRPIYDITGFDGHQVVRVLSDIVNNKDQFKPNKTFYLLIQGNPNDELEEFFKLQAASRATPHQPGNAVVFLRPRGKKRFERGGAKSYEELNGALKAFYDIYDDKGRLLLSDTTSFVKHIKQLFKNNAWNKDIPQATFEVYMILLFEIARRLVKSENPSDEKVKLDILPIGCAIARLINLLELGDKETCIFEDVFLTGGGFHCFKGKPKERRKAIENINEATFNTTEQKAVTRDDCLKELQEMFCSGERLAMMSIDAELKELKVYDPDSSSSPDAESSSSPDAETSSSPDAETSSSPDAASSSSPDAASSSSPDAETSSSPDAETSSSPDAETSSSPDAASSSSPDAETSS